MTVCLAASALFAQAQQDTRPVVGVAEFTCDTESPYARLVTEKVVEMLTNTKRFQVVDRTSIDKIHAELELQKSEAFLDSKNRVEQDVAVAAEKMITGHITKIPVYAMKNASGSLRGYKASVAFEMKVVDVATGLSNELPGQGQRRISLAGKCRNGGYAVASGRHRRIFPRQLPRHSENRSRTFRERRARRCDISVGRF